MLAMQARQEDYREHEAASQTERGLSPRMAVDEHRSFRQVASIKDEAKTAQADNGMTGLHESQDKLGRDTMLASWYLQVPRHE